MTTTNPRVHVTLSPSLYELVGHMAGVQRVSRSQVLRELLEAAEPALQRVVALMHAAERAKGAMKAGFAEDLLHAQERIEEALGIQLAGIDGTAGDLVDLAQRVEGRRPARRAAQPTGTAGGGTVPTPVPVTRGSGRAKVTTSRVNPGVKRGRL